MRWNGVRWSRVAPPEDWNAPAHAPRIFVAGPDTAWLHDGSTLYRHDAGGWSRVALPPGTRVHTLWAQGPRDVFIGTNRGQILRGSEHGWKIHYEARHAAILKIAGRSPTELLATTNDGRLLSFYGRTWHSQTVLPRWRARSEYLVDVLAGAHNEVWLITSWGRLLFSDGASWSASGSASGRASRRFLGAADGYVWIAGWGGEIWRWQRRRAAASP